LRSASRIEIDLVALEHNLLQVRQRVQHRKILAVVKADAYGHGAVEVARALASALFSDPLHGPESGVSMLGVAYLDEALSLRQAGLTLPILLMTGCSVEEIPDLVRHRITPVLFDMRTVTALSQYLAARHRTMDVHIKIDTGMGRLGVPVSDALDFIRKSRAQDGIRVEGILTHFAEADLQDLAFAEEQLALFEALLSCLAQEGIAIPYCHIANSAAIIRLSSAHLSLVRPGLMLYGYMPIVGGAPPRLCPIMQVRTRVLAIKNMRAGTPISYGRTYITPRDCRIAVTSIGYADGYPRALSNRGIMLASGRRVPVVGRVCMDMTMIDVTMAPSLQVGDWVTVIGSEGDSAIWADELARLCETIPYDILCGLGNHLPRTYTSPPSPWGSRGTAPAYAES